jgi:hypothetical protein
VPSSTARDLTVSSPDRAIADIAAHQGSLYESVSVSAGDRADSEPADHPYLVHQIQDGDPPAFTPLPVRPAVDYGGLPPTSLGGLQLSSDGVALWGAAGRSSPDTIPTTVVRSAGGGFAPLTLTDPAGALTPSVYVSDIGAEPGTDSAWVAYVPPLEAGAGTFPARLARVHADGTVDDVQALPGAADGVARKQQADRVACPAPGQCWMSTRVGWLFHLGGALPRDDEPAMHRLITYRPPDASTIVLSPDTMPDDDSGIAPPVFYEPPPVGITPATDDPTVKAKPKRLVTNVRSKVVHRTTLELRFTLTAKAHVQLLAKRKAKVVARTKRRTLAKGRHVLRLKLNAKRWPTKLDFRVSPIKQQQRPAGDDTTAGTPPGSSDPSEADDIDTPGTVTIARLRRGARQ